ncbi:MAG TPA: FliM/FliN family flagellar motor switch protein [Candidatus Binataceae bacterium]|nr:FliM/FliN family flagellar motor switch protein [Candidatus Binataceae bacterium]
MVPARNAENIAIEVEAVLSRLRMAAEEAAALKPGDRLEIEGEGGVGLQVQLVAAGVTVAIASLEVVDGKLVAGIINRGPGLTGRIDQWKHNKATTMD